MAKELFARADRRLAKLLAEMVWLNPFTEARAQANRDVAEVAGLPKATAGVEALAELAKGVLERAQPRLAHWAEVTPSEREFYQEVVYFLLFHQQIDAFDAYIADAHERGVANRKVKGYSEFAEALRHYLPHGFADVYQAMDTSRLFAVFFQIRRAYIHIFRYIIGESETAARLRARVWQSIFTHDLRRYQRVLADRMGDIITLITGPSGSGKEIVARGIGLSRYIPFDPQTRMFTDDFLRSFYPVNLSALSSNLIESELFGHRRGAFTGALQDRQGYLSACSAFGTVFLDEIGETEPAIQVKLLRLLQTRTFTPIGDTEPQEFAGKIMAATNRDLEAEIRAGRFREDFFFRLTADRVHTPALREILQGDSAELERLVAFIAGRCAGEDGPALTSEVCDFIQHRLPPDYAWPGNFRELEQCVRNIMVHGEYHPPHNLSAAAEGLSGLPRQYLEGQFTVETLIQDYIGRLYTRTPNLGELARRLGIDRRTVRKYALAAKPDTAEQD